MVKPAYTTGEITAIADDTSDVQMPVFLRRSAGGLTTPTIPGPAID